MEYEIIIKEREPFAVKETVYEGTDGKTYRNRYSLPDGIEFKEIERPTGETSHTERVVYSQKISELDLYEVIKAVNLNSA